MPAPNVIPCEADPGILKWWLGGVNSPNALAPCETFSGFMHANAIEESRAMLMPWRLPVELEGTKQAAGKVLPFGAPKPLIEAESKGNTPAPSAVPETVAESHGYGTVSKIVHHATPKPGRNDRYPCERGLKFMKYCNGPGKPVNSTAPPGDMKHAA